MGKKCNLSIFSFGMGWSNHSKISIFNNSLMFICCSLKLLPRVNVCLGVFLLHNCIFSKKNIDIKTFFIPRCKRDFVSMKICICFMFKQKTPSKYAHAHLANQGPITANINTMFLQKSYFEDVLIVTLNSLIFSFFIK